MAEKYTIEVEHISKSFKIFLDKGHELKDYVATKRRNRYEKREVLKDISFSVKRGEAIGLIGHNGCGKSTTLKMLTRIMYPDTGTIKMNGRVSSLIELGAGFHPDMSGRENIYINASIFGLTKKEIDRRLNDIIAFSELEEFIDNPVRTYSSGMYMRLAFSVAINVDADILLIDEILAVGDVNFQAKCFNRLREIKAQGVTIVIVSHSLGQIEQICDRVIWIDEGLVRMEGLPVEVDYAYLDYMGKNTKKVLKSSEDDEFHDKAEQPKNLDSSESKKEVKPVEILGAELVHSNGQKDDRFRVGEPVTLRINYKVNSEIDNPLIGLKIYRCDNVNAYGTNTQNERLKIELKEEGWIECYFPKLDFVASEYSIDIAFRSQDMLIYDYKTKILTFVTYYSVYEEGIAHLDHVWKIV